MGGRNKKSCVIWFTGLPGSGKTTLAEALCKELVCRGRDVEYLDGDKMRALFPAIGFSKEERDAHIRRTGFLASRLEAHGVVVVASFVSPYQEARAAVRGICGQFVEVYLNTPLEVCIQRDPKGMYRKAREGKITNFTGVQDPYEPPVAPELLLDTSVMTVREALLLVLSKVATVL